VQEFDDASNKKIAKRYDKYMYYSGFQKKRCWRKRKRNMIWKTFQVSC